MIHGSDMGSRNIVDEDLNIQIFVRAARSLYIYMIFVLFVFEDDMKLWIEKHFRIRDTV